MAKSLPKLMKNNKTPSQEAQRSKTWNKARTFSHNKLKERPTIKVTQKHFCVWASGRFEKFPLTTRASMEPFISGAGLEDISTPQGLIPQSCVRRWIQKLPKRFQVFPNTRTKAHYVLVICLLWQNTFPKPLVQHARGYTGSLPHCLAGKGRGQSRGPGALPDNPIPSRRERDRLRSSLPDRHKNSAVISNYNPSILISSWELL